MEAALDAQGIFNGTDFVKKDALKIVDSFLGFYTIHSQGLNASNTLEGFDSAASGFDSQVTPITDSVQSVLDTLELDLYDKVSGDDDDPKVIWSCSHYSPSVGRFHPRRTSTSINSTRLILRTIFRMAKPSLHLRRPRIRYSGYKTIGCHGFIPCSGGRCPFWFGGNPSIQNEVVLGMQSYDKNHWILLCYSWHYCNTSCIHRSLCELPHT